MRGTLTLFIQMYMYVWSFFFGGGGRGGGFKILIFNFWGFHGK